MHFAVVSTICVVFIQLVFHEVNGLPDIIRIGNTLWYRKSAVEYLIHFWLFFFRLLKIRRPIPSGRRQSRACISLCRRENKSRQNNFTTLKIDSANRTNPTQRQFPCIQTRWAAHKNSKQVNLEIVFAKFISISSVFLFSVSLSFASHWCRWNIRPSIIAHSKSCAKYLWHHGGAAFGNPMGLSIASRKLSSKFIPSSEHLVARKCCLSSIKKFYFNLIQFWCCNHKQAYVDIVKSWGWKSFTIIYETNEGLVRLQELLKAHGPSEFPITVRQLPDTNDYRWDKVLAIKRMVLYLMCCFSPRCRPLLKQIKNSAVAHIVLDCSTDKIYDVLKQSQQIGMMSDYHSYLITSLVNLWGFLFRNWLFDESIFHSAGSSNARFGTIQVLGHKYNGISLSRSG